LRKNCFLSFWVFLNMMWNLTGSYCSVVGVCVCVCVCVWVGGGNAIQRYPQSPQELFKWNHAPDEILTQWPEFEPCVTVSAGSRAVDLAGHKSIG
jgi:hypothetical protein